MNKNCLLTQLSAAQFAMWELHLYLDTHPEDVCALALHKKYSQKYNMLKDEFECKYYKLTPDNAQGVSWLRDPWPWEKDGCCR